MDADYLFPIAIVALIIWLVIMHNIIESASKSKQITLYLKMQCDLLAKIAEKQGVEASEITEIVNRKLTTKKG